MNERQRTNQIDPATVPTPKGFQRVNKFEPLRPDDMFLHCGLLKWTPVSTTPIKENYYTNCIRPIQLIPEHVTA